MENKSEENVADLIALLRDPISGIEIKDRKWMLRTYPKCFVGKEFVDWAVENKHAATRKDAVSMGNMLLDLNVFQHVTKDHRFKDENLFYRFLDDDPNFFSQDPGVSWAELLETDQELMENLNARLQERTDETFTPMDEMNLFPLDKWNVHLLDNVHPPKWNEPTPQGTYNVVVIGGGTAGLVTAAGAAGLGAKVALIEKHLMGGDCLNFGCVPSKALIRAARAIYDVKNSLPFGVEAREVNVDFPAIMERMRKLRAEISGNDSANRFAEKLGVDVFIGHAKFVDKETVEVNGKKLKFAKACIATGARPSIPRINGIESVTYLTNETVFNLTTLPSNLCVLGGGPIGCELAQAFARFGSKVTILEVNDQIMPREDKEAASIVQNQFEKEGIKMYFKCQYSNIAQKEDGTKVISILHDGNSIEISCNEILVSTGRKPNVENLGLELAGVKYDTRKGIQVNDKLQTTNSNIFSCGDCCTLYKFTHVADFMARIVIRNALFFGKSKVSTLTIPWATYSDPEVAHVGLYERDCISRGIKYSIFTKKFSDIDRAIIDGEDDGFVKVIVKEGTDEIIGSTIVSRHAGEMISEITTCIVGKVGLQLLSTVIHPYPTQTEAIRKIGDEYNRTRLTPVVKVFFRKLLAARR